MVFFTEDRPCIFNRLWAVLAYIENIGWSVQYARKSLNWKYDSWKLNCSPFAKTHVWCYLLHNDKIHFLGLVVT